MPNPVCIGFGPAMKTAHQEDSNDTPQPIGESQVSFPLLRISIYLPTPNDFKTLPIDLRNFLALEQRRRLLLLLWKKNAARKF